MEYLQINEKLRVEIAYNKSDDIFTLTLQKKVSDSWISTGLKDKALDDIPEKAKALAKQYKKPWYKRLSKENYQLLITFYVIVTVGISVVTLFQYDILSPFKANADLPPIEKTITLIILVIIGTGILTYKLIQKLK